MDGDLKTQLEFGADASGAVAGINTVKKSLDTLGKDAAAAGKQAAAGLDAVGAGGAPAAAKVDAATRNMIGSIQRQIAATEAGARSGAEYYRVLASQRGIDPAALKPYLDQLDAVAVKQKAAQAAVQASAPAIENLGMSAKATAAALRGVPAQFTDIAVSLQGGQAPLTVLLQQGGQLKDMFGGIGPAAQALGGYMASLVTPVSLVAAAVGALGLAYYQGSQEGSAYTKALTMTGNAAGKTAADLQVMALNISRTTGTQGQAADALEASVSGGKIAAQALQAVGEASVTMARVLGGSVDKAVESFEKLADDPAKSAAKLNEQFNFLTVATYERIRALQEQGRTEEATALAQVTYANATTERLRQVESQTGVLATAWRMLGTDARKAWDLMQGLGRAKTTGELLGEAQQNLAQLEARGPLNRFPTGLADHAVALANARATVEAGSRLALRQQESAAAEGERARSEREKIAAQQRLDEQKKATRSRADQRADEIKKLDADAKLVGLAADDYAKRLANINEKFKDPKGPKEKPFRDDASTRMLETLRQQEAALQAQLLGTAKITEAEREQAKFVQLVTDLKGKDQLTADQKSLLGAQEKIKAQLALNVATEREVEFQKLLVTQSEKRRKAIEATQNFADGNRQRAADSLTQQREQYDDRLGVLGLGSEAAEQLRSRQQIEREYARMQTQATIAAGKNGTLDSDAYKQGAKDIQAALALALSANTEYYAALKEKQGDWALGASQALANYRDESANAFKQTEQLATRAFGGMEDALVSFVTTGKGDFKSLANSIIADFVRIQVRAAMSGVMGGVAGGLSGGAAAGLANIFGGGDKLGTMINLMGLAGARAEGGPVDAGKTYLVGERGQELFVPKVPGNIVPNHQLGAQPGGGMPWTIVNNTTGRIDRARVENTPQGPRLTIEEVAAQFDDPNSQLSKAYRRNYRSERARP